MASDANGQLIHCQNKNGGLFFPTQYAAKNVILNSMFHVILSGKCRENAKMSYFF